MVKEEKRVEGIIKWYNPNKAFGFIFYPELDTERNTIFFHKTHLRNSLFFPQEGDKVNFIIREGDKGLFCDDVVMGEIGEEDE